MPFTISLSPDSVHKVKHNTFDASRTDALLSGLDVEPLSFSGIKTACALKVARCFFSCADLAMTMRRSTLASLT